MLTTMIAREDMAVCNAVGDYINKPVYLISSSNRLD